MSFALARRVSLAAGAFYVLFGLLGFLPAVTAPTDVEGQGTLLGVFLVGPLLNVAHVALGVLMLWAAMDRGRRHELFTGIACLFVVAGVIGFIPPLAASLSINVFDSILHVLTAALLGNLLSDGSEPELVPEPTRPGA